MPAVAVPSQVEHLAICLKRVAEHGGWFRLPMSVYRFLSKRYIKKYGYATAMEYAESQMYR